MTHQVERAAARVAAARFALAVEVVKAHEEGQSLRVIAKAADLSHETVRRLIRTDQASGS